MKRLGLTLALMLTMASAVVVSGEDAAAGWTDGARTSGIGWCGSC